MAPPGHASLGRLAAEYVNDEDGLAPANFFLLTPLKRSAEYGKIRDRVTRLKPVDAWSLDNLHYFVFDLAGRDGKTAGADTPVALFVMSNDEKPVSALVIQPNGRGGEAEVEDLRNPNALFKMAI